ncbi:hypothetical protein [Nostoc sp. MG11]|nr:hypothetical protein [Nostoc sp. MG11]
MTRRLPRSQIEPVGENSKRSSKGQAGCGDKSKVGRCRNLG